MLMITIEELNRGTTVFGPVEIRTSDEQGESETLYSGEDGIFCDDDLYKREILTIHSDSESGIVIEV